MKKIILCLKQKVTAGHEKDYGVMNGYKTVKTISGGGYERLFKKAELLSTHISELEVDGTYFWSDNGLERGLGVVTVETIFVEKDRQGVVCDYFMNGEHMATHIEDATYYIEQMKKEREFGTMKAILKKLQKLQIEYHINSFNIDYRFDEKNEPYICVMLFIKHESPCNNFAFYDFRSVDDNIKEYECLLEVLEGRTENRREWCI